MFWKLYVWNIFRFCACLNHKQTSTILKSGYAQKWKGGGVFTTAISPIAKSSGFSQITTYPQKDDYLAIA